MLINCDIGERGAEHPVDVELMKWIHVANIACGGHAGDAESVANFRRLAEVHDVRITAHLSYPDRENFGRVSLAIDGPDLEASLDEQYELMNDVKWVKFHGALYNDSCVDVDLANKLCQWLKKKGIELIICPEKTVMAKACATQDLEVMVEAFAERRYAFQGGQLGLVKRTKPYASIHAYTEALEQSKQILKKNRVLAYLTDAEQQWRELSAQTICIHSDSAIALELAKGLQKLV